MNESYWRETGKENYIIYIYIIIYNEFYLFIFPNFLKILYNVWLGKSNTFRKLFCIQIYLS